MHLKLLSLARQHVRVTRLRAEDVHYWMRVKVKSTKGIERRLAAYPHLDDLPGNPSLVETEIEKKQKGGGLTVDVDGIDVRIAELWFMEYHYVGPGTLTGGFVVGPNRMRVGTSVQNVGPGELRFGPDQVIVDNFRGRIQATIPEVDPERHADESFLELVDADIELGGNIRTLSHLGAYAKGVKVRDGAGPLAIRLFMRRGDLGENSRFAFSTKKVGLVGKGYGIESDIALDARVERAERPSAGEPSDAAILPRLRARSEATYVSFANERNRIFTVQAHGHEEEVVLRTKRLGRMTDIDHARVRLPKILSTDLHDLAAVTSEGTSVQSKGGEARAALELDMDARHVARGRLQADLDDVDVTVAGMEFFGRGDASCSMRLDLKDETTMIEDFSLRLRNVGMRAGSESVRDWWTTVSVPHFLASGLPPKRLQGGMIAVAKNAEPLLKGLAEKNEISRIIPELTKLRNVHERASMRRGDGVTDVFFEPIQNELFDMAGRYYSARDHDKLALVIGGKAVSLGIAKDDAGTRLEPFARSEWLNRELRRFPTPEQVRSSQP